MLIKKNQHKRDFITPCICVCTSIMYLLSFFSGYFDPRTHILMAFWGLLLPVTLALHLLSGVLTIYRKRWGFLALQILTILFTYQRINAHLGLRRQSISDKTAQIKVMTYNVHYFNTLATDKSRNTALKVEETINQQKPDILCMQEFYFKKHGKYDFKDSILKNTAFKYAYFEPTMSSQTETIGLIIFSKYPIRHQGAIYFDKKKQSGNMAIYADILVKNKIIRMYNLHLQSLKFQSQDYDYILQNDLQNKEIKPAKRILNLIKTGFEKRAEQVDQMQIEFKKCNMPYIVCGDFNDTPGSNAIHRLLDNLNNTFSKKGSGWGSTFYTFFIPFQIDYIAHTKDIKTVSYQSIPVKLSDHFPITAGLKIQ